MHRLAEDAEAHQRRDGLFDGFGREPPRGRDLAAEARHLLLVEDLGGRTRDHLVDDETDGVGADIDDGERSGPKPEPAGRGQNVTLCAPLDGRGSGGWNSRVICHVLTDSGSS